MAEPCYKSSLLNRAKVTSESQEMQTRDPSCQFFNIHSIFLVTMFLIVINNEKIVNHECGLPGDLSSTLAWKIPWTEKPGRLQSMGSLGVGHD